MPALPPHAQHLDPRLVAGLLGSRPLPLWEVQTEHHGYRRIAVADICVALLVCRVADCRVVVALQKEVASVSTDVFGDRLLALLLVEDTLVDHVLDRATRDALPVVAHVVPVDPLVANLVLKERLQPISVEQEAHAAMVVAVLLPHPRPRPGTVEARTDPDPIASIAAERQVAHRVACRLDVAQDCPRRKFGTGWVARPADSGQNVLTLHGVRIFWYGLIRSCRSGRMCSNKATESV